jgi:hypothetical protein
MLTSTFKARKSRSGQNRSMSANESFIKLARRSQSLGLDAFNVAGDGHCFFRTLSITLVDLLGSKAAKLLLQVDCSHTALRDFLCSWAEDHHDDVVDDEGEETLAQRAADAALAWERPVAAIDDDGRVISVEERFAAVLTRMHGRYHLDWGGGLPPFPAALNHSLTGTHTGYYLRTRSS